MMNEYQERDTLISRFYEMATDLGKDYTWDKNKALFDLVYDWNANHESSLEIFLCEIWKDDGYDYDGVMVEDTPFAFAE